MSKRIVLLLALVAVLVVASCAKEAEPTEAPAPAAPTETPVAVVPAAPAVDELVIWWAEWDPANYLQEVGNMYEEETGIKVTVVQEPWGSYFNRVSAEWAARGTGFDMVVGDSQWIGQAVTEGHYVDMTGFLTSTGLKDTVTEATLTYYGEYPPGSGNYYAYPTEGDANGWAYRTDLVDNPDEKAAFAAEYGYEYSVPPKDYNEFVDMSEFFYRPDENIYGAAVYTQKDYDAITMGFQNSLFTYGCDWNENFKVDGVLNKPECVEALEAYKALYDSGPPGNTNSFFPEMNDYFINGQAVFSMNYFAFLPALANPGTDPNYWDKVGFFSNPPGPYGQQYASLGGQGTSINAYISDERKAASLAFIEWFAQDDIQMEWAALGGYTCNKKALASPEFLAAAPYNAAFAETMGMVKDFYNIPEYGELLPSAQAALSNYVVGGQGTAQEALDAIAAEHEAIFKTYGYLKEGEAPVGITPDLGNVEELVIWWAEWDPANYLQEVGNMFEAETGVKVTVVQEPWGSYFNRVSAEWAARGTGFDMVVGDSQWIGQAVTEGHYVDMTGFLTSTGLKDTVTEATLTYYGEYPPGSGNYYAYPTEGDANGWAYRTDLVDNPDEKAAFAAEYGYEYSVPPKDYNEFVDMSEFFYRPDENIYGAAVYTQKDYDAITMGFQNSLFTYGCDWNENFKVDGVLNKPECVEALEAYKALYDSGPPGNTNSFFPEMNDYFINGQAVFSMNYFAFLPALANPGTDPNYWDKVGFFSNPPGPYGQQYASLGGQGTSINAYISDERKAASLAFIEWFAQDDIQMEWAALGGYTCNKKALASPEFLAAAPYNAAFAETMGMVKDFYNIPEYGELLPSAQAALSNYVVGGQGTAQEALDAIAAEHEAIFKTYGYLP